MYFLLSRNISKGGNFKVPVMQDSTPNSEQRDSLLLIEDDQKVCQAMVAYLEKNNYDVTAAMSGEAALKKVSSEVFDLVVLDLNLPGLDGMEVLKNIRSRGNTPVLVVSARQGGKDRVTALDAGADDFLTKPYYPEELLARVGSVLRRAQLPSTKRPDQTLQLDPSNRTVLLMGKPVKVTRTEFELLRVLASEEKTFSREELFRAVWRGEEFDSKSHRRVDIQVSRLRARLQTPQGSELLESVYGVGYRLAAEAGTTGAV